MKKKFSTYLGAISIVAALLLSATVQAQRVQKNKPVVYNDVFISYYSPENVAAMADFAEQKQLGGFILWEFRGDMPFNDKRSLLAQLPVSMNSNSPLVMGYWTNWSVYTNTSARAIPQPAYPVPGSLGNESGLPVVNNDFSQKLEGMSVVTYAFLQAQTNSTNNPGQTGTLYFSDPWADLQKTGSAEQDRLCGKGTDPKYMSVICTFAWRGTSIVDNENMGNFNAFAKLTHSGNQQPGALKKVFSVAGYGHDAVFEDTFVSQIYINNFVTSAKQIIDAYKLDGIDLDYENPAMTRTQSSQYLTLVKELRRQLPGKFISVTILADPGYLNGVRSGDKGFAAGVLREMAEHVDHINLMTYDFHGAFDYSPDGKGTTGFLTNLYMPDNAPLNYQFSVDTSVQAALDAGIPAKKLSIGIPAYGRAIMGIAKENGGLFQTIKASTAGIPRGDLDAADCTTDIPFNTTKEPCSGSFRYDYILNSMVDHGFAATEHKAQGASNGVSAYAAQWSPAQSASYKLRIKNAGTGSDAGFNVTIGSFAAPDFFNLGATKEYTPDIAGQKGLSVSAKWWNGVSECVSKLDFNSDMSVEIAVSAGGVPDCKYTKMDQ